VTTTTEITNTLSASALDAARALFAAGDYGEALEMANQIEADENASFEAQFGAKILKASIYSETDRAIECVATLELAAPIVDEAPARLKASFYGQRAYVAANAGRFDDAVVDYEGARTYAHESGDLVVEARVRNNLARQYSRVGKFDDAITESDAAISIMLSRGDDLLLGRFYDQRAWILLEHTHFSEALRFSENALAMLAHHPSITEARATHGRILIALGASYLEQPDRIETFRARRAAEKSIAVSLDAEIVELALRKSGGQIVKASALLNVRHSALIRAIKKFHLERKPSRRRGKPVVEK
jgi:tetratricopeptide (TPR) repeat protein